MEPLRMTPQSQRIAIAEACGWKRAQSKGVVIEGWLKDNSWSVHLPDFLSDLNAMHEAEEKLTDDEWELYRALLVKASFISGLPTWRCAIHAPAAHRAEAFLRTLGLWKSN